MKTEFHCPKCGSDDTASFPSAYAAGTKTMSLGGLTMGGDGDIGLAAGGGVSQTRLAASIAPPRKKDFWGGLLLPLGIGWTVMLCCLASEGNKDDAFGAYVISLLGIVIAWAGVWDIRRVMRYNANVWPGLHATWQTLWLCRRCGETFVPEPKDIAPEAKHDPIAERAADRMEDKAFESLLERPASSLSKPEYIICNMCGAKLRKPPAPGRFKCPKCSALVVA